MAEERIRKENSITRGLKGIKYIWFVNKIKKKQVQKYYLVFIKIWWN